MVQTRQPLRPSNGIASLPVAATLIGSTASHSSPTMTSVVGNLSIGDVLTPRKYIRTLHDALSSLKKHTPLLPNHALSCMEVSVLGTAVLSSKSTAFLEQQLYIAKDTKVSFGQLKAAKPQPGDTMTQAQWNKQDSICLLGLTGTRESCGGGRPHPQQVSYWQDPLLPCRRYEAVTQSPKSCTAESTMCLA